MRVHLPNSAHLHNLAAFLRGCSFADARTLTVSCHPKWVSVHPVVIALTAAAAAAVRAQSGSVRLTGTSPRNASLRYLATMKLFDTLGVEPPERIRPHEPAGRFIPLTQIRTSAELSSFIVDIVPLLHATRPEVEPIQYVISELVRNVIEHAGSSDGAFVCAQYYKAACRLALGVADAGIGLRESLGRNYSPATDLDSIYLAMRPGVSGTSPGLYGTDYNAGAGLFFTKSIARASDNLFVICTGRAFFKLLKTPPSKRDSDIKIYADPKQDRHIGRNDLPSWPGTVVGIDIAIGRGSTFADLLAAIRSVYSIDKAAAREGFKKPQFI